MTIDLTKIYEETNEMPPEPQTRSEMLVEALAPARLTRVLDVGASPLTEPAYKPLLDQGSCHVWGFEPDEKGYANLQEQKGENETYFNLAVGAPGDRKLYVHPRPGFTSLYEMCRKSVNFMGKGFWKNKGIKPIDVNLTMLDDVAELPRMDLLKMDLQGGELEVMQGGVDRLSEAVMLVPEVRFHRIYENEPLWSDIDKEAQKQGFKLHKLMFAKSVMLPHSQEALVRRGRMTAQLLDGDAVYIPDTDRFNALDAESLKHLAILADAVVASYSLCLMCLDRLVAIDAAPQDLPERYARALPEQLLK